ncbi:MAG: DUF1330 domain-containing protein [Alphaproteobacteria bacterium]
MPAYLIAENEVHDPQMMKAYLEKVGPTVAAYGGKTLAAGGEIAHMEGSWRPKRVAVLEFPSMAAAKAWYNSPEYQEILPLRLNASNGSLIFLDGLG